MTLKYTLIMVFAAMALHEMAWAANSDIDPKRLCQTLMNEDFGSIVIRGGEYTAFSKKDATDELALKLIGNNRTDDLKELARLPYANTIIDSLPVIKRLAWKNLDSDLSDNNNPRLVTTVDTPQYTAEFMIASPRVSRSRIRTYASLTLNFKSQTLFRKGLVDLGTAIKDYRPFMNVELDHSALKFQVEHLNLSLPSSHRFLDFLFNKYGNLKN